MEHPVTRSAWLCTSCVLAACGEHPAATLYLRQRLLLPPAQLIDSPAHPLQGLHHHGVTSDTHEPRITGQGQLKVSLSKGRTQGRADVLSAVLLRDTTVLRIPDVLVHEGDIFACYTGSIQRRRRRGSLRPSPLLELTAVAADGARLRWSSREHMSRPDHWTERRVDLSPLAGKRVTIELRLSGWFRADEDHIFVGDPALYSTVAPPRPRLNVVLLWLDKFRADFLESMGGPKAWTPRLNALAKESVSFTNARSNANHTRVSVLQTFFSTLSVDVYTHMARVALPSLASELATAGYYTLSSGTNPHTTARLPEWAVESIDAGHDRLNCDLRMTKGFDDSFLFRTYVEPWLQDERREPFFYNVHYQGAHEAFERIPADYQARYGAQALELAHQDPLEAAYFLKAKWADEVVGMTLDRLKAEGLWERTLLVVLADHAANMGPDHRYFQRGTNLLVRLVQGTALYEEQVRVPLIIHASGVPPSRRDEPVSLLDLAPTILVHLGQPVPPQFEGRALSLTGPAPTPTPTFFACDIERIYGVLDPPYKYIYDSEAEERWPVRPDFVGGNDWYYVPTEQTAFDLAIGKMQRDGWVGARKPVQRELFDLEHDPREQDNLVDREPEQASRLHELLARSVFLANGPYPAALHRHGLTVATPKPGVFSAEVTSTEPLKLEAVQGACTAPTLDTTDRRRIVFTCALPEGGQGGFTFFKTLAPELRVRVTLDGQPVSPEMLFLGEFGLPAATPLTDGYWVVGPDTFQVTLPEASDRAVLLTAHDEGVFLFRLRSEPSAESMTAGLQDVFAQWGYAKR